jgi:hypothetical protein
VSGEALQDQVLGELVLLVSCLEEAMLSVQLHIPCNSINDSLFIIDHIELQETFNSRQVNAYQPNMATQIKIEFMGDLVSYITELKVRAAFCDNIIS